MGYRYAQIKRKEDGYGYVINDGRLSSKVDSKNMILLSEGFELDGKRWNYEVEAWEEYEPEPTPEPEPPLTEQEQLAVDTALNVEYMVCLMEESLG